MHFRMFNADLLAEAPLLTQVSSSLTHLKLSLLLDDDEINHIRRGFWVDLSTSVSIGGFTHLGLLECHLRLVDYTRLRGDHAANYLEGMVEECRTSLREFDEMGVLRIVLDPPSDD